MSVRDRRIDVFWQKAKAWHEEGQRFRAILLDCGLDETMRWRQPCYQMGGGNVALVSVFKDYCALAFFKGTLLDDPAGLLIAPGENSQAVRQVRVRSVEEIERNEGAIRNLIARAVAAEKAGLKVEMPAREEFEPVAELAERLATDPPYKAAFEALTPGRRRAWNLHFGDAKKPETRAGRVEKARAAIFAGKGLNDR